MRIVAHIISIIFHPILMPVIGMFLIFKAGTHLSLLTLQAKQAILIVIFISTVILPLSIHPILYQFKIIKSYRMESTRERIIPILITAFFYYTAFLLLKKMGVPTMLCKYIISAAITVFVSAIITYFWKISIHMMGIGGLSGVITAISLKYGIDLLFLQILLISASALTASARLYLGDHNPSQVYTGYIFGFVIIFSFIIF